MRIIDLTKEHEDLYFVCLEDWSDDMKEAGEHKRNWYKKMKDKGLRVKLAINNSGVAAGMIEYLPVEYSIANGQDLYFINCIWIHGHKQGRGDMRKQGFGKALLKAAEDDARQRGAKGMTAFGLSLPVWIPASFFKKQGYTSVDKDGILVLMYKPFSGGAKPPALIRKKKTPNKNENPGKVTVTFLLTGHCPGRNIVYERAKRAASVFGDKVVFNTIDTSNRETYIKWGMQNELFIEDKHINFGPALPYKKVKKLIQKQVNRL